jgi:hypothetical protein
MNFDYANGAMPWNMPELHKPHGYLGLRRRNGCDRHRPTPVLPAEEMVVTHCGFRWQFAARP